VDIADFRGLTRQVTLRPQYNLLAREIEWEIVPACQAAGLGPLPWSPPPWSPLASGWLSGKYQRDAPPPAGTRMFDQVDVGTRNWNQRGHLDRTWQPPSGPHATAGGQSRPPAAKRRRGRGWYDRDVSRGVAPCPLARGLARGSLAGLRVRATPRTLLDVVSRRGRRGALASSPSTCTGGGP
jgi:hypothetical protein